ncbi:hypothetical protein A3F07_04725 [candidate division WWE3 bacterium RIFCSPHIGHO2_12_FULL_38_15]|uniref:Uncharacterized protein n=1 Tax=candidate division WWE3 bacterium RIFCSPHIGHO2_02_FULL_38_14 TaxID=1802620 RepID=A0A1F4V7V8_UNCKA|nr:MAG: hypothetical protein A2793_00355 [candidate division WWE3 bacterium RIFCSPHIGHO2_01_FULL_38_45]OGC49545.1 MAG: hypothetical protein A3F07_04725 [candidate division WWE3 bacterium RIFCSPHIGHO2_12_FULL_38_15]OGC52471.1 MAG: hypothetical protein A3B64_02665 [candidate division WWE3 bacterium RIFCSPLOWO2_01_FULL_37_24]OGC53301.1 MAG: hypothetical protein A3D91_02720 [candidate division WWE3 bacterium RIFCSPHIGHO2_02_FULL_38_14]HLB51810.1 hypothetical protein [Patescibacteria group bacterium
MTSNKPVILLLVLLLILVSVNVYQNILIDQKLLQLQSETKNRITQVPEVQNKAEEPLQEETDSFIQDKFTVRGVIRKEKIPAELELGEYWYWINFEEPYLLKDNASGWPQYIDKIQLFPPQDTSFYKLDDYLNKHVEIYGYNSWGYAESSVIQVISMTEL